LNQIQRLLDYLVIKGSKRRATIPKPQPNQLKRARVIGTCTNLKTTNLKTTNLKTTNLKTTNLKTTNLKTTNPITTIPSVTIPSEWVDTKFRTKFISYFAKFSVYFAKYRDRLSRNFAK
jgi:hypothetical protein